MSKKVHIILAVIYFLFVGVLGVVLVITLPQFNYSGFQIEQVHNDVTNGHYSDAMQYIGGYYHDEYDSYTVNGHELALFNAAAFNATDNKTYYLEKAYVGFFTNVDSKYNITSNSSSAKILINNNIEIKILDYDHDSDGTNDSISTLIDGNYIYFEIFESVASNINSISFIDSSNDVYAEYTGLNYQFNEQFFIDSTDVIAAYNVNPNSVTDEFRTKSDTFIQNEHYCIGGTTNKVIQKKAMLKTLKQLIFYIIIVAFFADFICMRYIIKLIKFIYYKIVNKIEKKKNESLPTFGKDYFSALTINWKYPEGFKEIINLEISNKDFTYMITSGVEGDYNCVNRIHAGIYKITKFECEGFELENINDTIEVSGYQRAIDLTIKKTNNC